jgi:diguanylate cyclase (GGDEF)-like protein
MAVPPICLAVCRDLATDFSAAVAAEGLDDVQVAAFPRVCDVARPDVRPLRELIDTYRERGDVVVVVGGICLRELADLTADEGVRPAADEGVRLVSVSQCLAPIVGEAELQRHYDAGRHVVTAGWLADWRDAIDRLGFDRATAAEFFAESADELVLLDTGVDEDAGARLRELADFLGLPATIDEVGLTPLRLFVARLIARHRGEAALRDAQRRVAVAERRAADYAMSVDMLGGLAGVRQEPEAIERILDIAEMLFAPALVMFEPRRGGRVVPAVTRTLADEVSPAAAADALAAIDGPAVQLADLSGFAVRLERQDELLGELLVAGCAFPDHVPDYLNLAASLAPICALAVTNARSYEEVELRNRQLAGLNAVGAALSSSPRMVQMLAATLPRIVEVTGYGGALVSLLDEASGRLTLAGSEGVPDELLRMLQHDGYEGTPCARLVELASAGDPQAAPSARRMACEALAPFGMRGYATAPIEHEGKVLGSLCLVDRTEHDDPVSDEAFAAAIARQLGVAVSGARLFAAVEQRVRETETLRSAASIVTSALDVDQVLRVILEQLERVVPYDEATVLLRDDERLVSAARRRRSVAADGGRATADAPVAPRQTSSSAWVAAPLVLRDELQGFLVVRAASTAAYESEEAALAQALADHAAIAINNARLYEATLEQALTDPLTGLANRRHFLERARAEVLRAERYGSALSLVMIDVDHFKLVNDTWGHAVGDVVLAAIGRVLSDRLRDVDLAARYGGEEFAVLLPEQADDTATATVERLRRAIRDAAGRALVAAAQDAGAGIDEESVSVTVSAGICTRRPELGSLEELVEAADAALYQAKDDGRDRVQVWRR